MKKRTFGYLCAVAILIGLIMLTSCSSQTVKEAISECGKKANEIYPGPQKGESYLQKLNEVKNCMLDKGFQIDQDGFNRYMELNSKNIKDDNDREKYGHIAYTIEYVWK